MLGFYGVRKLQDSRNVSDRLQSQSVPLDEFVPTGKPIRILNRTELDEIYKMDMPYRQPQQEGSSGSSCGVDRGLKDDRSFPGSFPCPLLRYARQNGRTARTAVGVSSQLLKKGQEAMVAYERAGDQAMLVASSRKTREKLGWTPRKSELESIISDAWYWMWFIPAAIAPE
jgi:hypothetical protein